MIFRFIGTGASEGYPAPFCGCSTCQEAKDLGGKNLRRRSCAVIDDQVLLDFGPDLYTANLTGLVDLSAVTTIVFTHSHPDHLYERELVNLLPPMAVANPNLPLTIYGNETVIGNIKACLTGEMKRSLDQLAEVMTLVTVQPFERFSVGNLTFTALPAHHAGPDEEAYIYQIQSGDKALLYGTDTGLLPEATEHYLKQHPLDLYIFDATSGPHPCPYKEHMGFPEIAQTLSAIGVQSRPELPVYGTHFVHGYCGSHEDLVAQGDAYGIRPAYDGLTLEL